MTALYRRRAVYLALLAADADRWTSAAPNVTLACRLPLTLDCGTWGAS